MWGLGLSRERRYAMLWRRLQDAPAIRRASNLATTARYLQVVLQESLGERLTDAQRSMLQAEASRVWAVRQAEWARLSRPPPAAALRPSPAAPRRRSPPRSNAAANRLVREAAAQVARNRANAEARRRQLADLERRRKLL